MIFRILNTILTAVLVCSCSQHFISDRNYLKDVESDLELRADILSSAGVNLKAMNLDKKEYEALEFLYAYMYLGDIMNNSPEFYRECCDYTFKAVREMPWGEEIPERELRHFVLPPRVNNENLDGCRPVFFEELAPLVRNMSMADAVLEVNHWCHSKVSYKPSDSRTSAPLATIRTSYGRCGEESTLLVAALRSVGIPARQIYTPRWAHTDDNHAWVEAWVDGEWHFLGACEPEPVLDLAWFNGPASRGMLMATNVFGRYDGPEEKLEVTPLYTRINVVGNYSPEPRRLDVQVVDAEGLPVKNARVEYKIYNYAEFYSAAVLTADENGLSGMTVGNGDMLVYASDDNGNFGFAKSSPQDRGCLQIILRYNKENTPPSMALSIVPPPERRTIPEVSEELRSECKARIDREDSLRTAYIGTFRTAGQSEAFARSIGLDAYKVKAALMESCGNYREVEDFLSYASEHNRGGTALRILSLISQKDLRDTPSDVLKDHLDNCPDGADDNVLNPRISTELLRPWRGTLQRKVDPVIRGMLLRDPSEFIRWCADSISILEGINNDYTSVDPVRVWESRVADKNSRGLFFVAVCRCFGIPAWKDNVTGAVRYSFEGKTYDADFESESRKETALGTVRLNYTATRGMDNPKYYIHFSISSFDGKSFHQLEYPEDGTWEAIFKDGTKLEPGLYMLNTGIRMESGEVFSSIGFFTVTESSVTDAGLLFSSEIEDIRVIGSLDPETGFLRANDGETVNVRSETDGGYFVLALLDGGSEPTVHTLKDIEANVAGFEAWGQPVLLVFADREEYKKYGTAQYRLPSNVRIGIDEDGSVRKALADGMKLTDKSTLPFVAVADTSGRIMFFSQGYTIGLGDRILTMASELR